MAARVGNEFIIFVVTGTDGTSGEPIFTEVGGQRGASFEESREMIDLSSKSSDHTFSGYGRMNTTGSLEGLVLEGDEGYDALRAAMTNRQTIMIQLRDNGTPYEEAEVLVSNLSRDFPDNEAVTASAELQLNSPLTPVSGAAQAAVQTEDSDSAAQSASYESSGTAVRSANRTEAA